MSWLALLLACVAAPAESAPLAGAPPVDPPAAALVLEEAPLVASDPGTLRERATTLGLAWPLAGLRLEVDKSRRLLAVYAGEVLVKRYRVGLGDPEGDKERQGDRRTPEGSMTIVTRNAASQFHKFLGVSYPTAEDATRGLRDGLITRAQAEAIRAAEAAGRRPPWETRLGGTVGIHGGGGSVDWTLGCIAVTDEEIDELWEVVRLGTPLLVRP